MRLNLWTAAEAFYQKRHSRALSVLEAKPKVAEAYFIKYTLFIIGAKPKVAQAYFIKIQFLHHRSEA
jgi:hypothetical protein